MVQITLVVLASADLLVDLVADLCVPFGFLLDELEDVEFLELLSLLQLFNDLAAFLVGIGISAGSYQEDGGLDSGTELIESALKVLLRADALEIGGGLEVWHQPLRILIVLSDALGENGRWLVRAVSLGHLIHALLADILRALQREHTARRRAVFVEEFGLELSLREVFDEDAWHDLH